MPGSSPALLPWIYFFIAGSLSGMPKRTKKEKIIAEYRRKLIGISSRPEAITSDMPREVIQKNHSTSTTFTLTNISSAHEHHDTLSLDPKEFLAIKKDLLTTLGITIFILIGQITIWKMMG